MRKPKAHVDPNRLCRHCKHLTEAYGKAKDGHYILGRCTHNPYAIQLRSPRDVCAHWERATRPLKELANESH